MTQEIARKICYHATAKIWHLANGKYLFSHTSSNFDHFRNKCEILFVTYGFIFAKGK